MVASEAQSGLRELGQAGRRELVAPVSLQQVPVQAVEKHQDEVVRPWIVHVFDAPPEASHLSSSLRAAMTSRTSRRDSLGTWEFVSTLTVPS